MDNKTILTIAVGAALLALATGAYASQAPSLSTDEGGDLPYWKTNEYPKYAQAIADAETRYGILVDLLARVLYQESRYRADVIAGIKRNAVGALGIAQFMPDTGEQYGLVTKDAAGRIVRDDRVNPFASIDAAGRYLRALYAMFGNWESALMAYNWGPGNVLKYNRGEHVTVPIETSTYLAQITADVPITA